MTSIKSCCTIMAMVAALCIPAFGKGVQERTVTNAQAQKKIIIGTVASDFRDKVVEVLVEKYRGTATIEVRDLGKLATIKPQDYTVIVVIDELQAWLKFNRTFKKLLDQYKDSGKLVVLMTAGDPKFQLDYKGVDAVSTASAKGQEQAIAAKVAEKIDAILKK